MLLVPEHDPTKMLMVPLVAEAGISARIVLSSTTINPVVSPLNCISVAPVNPEPLMVMLSPGHPEGTKELY